MYKAEAELFLSANNNISYAKTLINECKRLISEAELPNNSDYANCKKCITDCNIGGLVELVENTKESLFQIDSQFATEYMTLLQEYMQTDTIDLSNMSDEEKMQYSIQMDSYMRDYNYNLLYMLEKYENSGQLTGEMKQQLDIQRLIVKQYGIQDEMAGLVPTSDEYIRLFNMNASIDMTLISANQSLTAEQKKAALESYEQNYNASLEILELNRDISLLEEELKSVEYGSEAYYEIENEIKNLQIDYLEGKENLTAEEQKQLDFLYQGVELNDLYIAQEQNNGFFHPFVENELDEAILDQKISMGIATEDEIAYDQMNVFERTWEDTKTVVVSTALGVGSVTETLVDGTVMLAGNVGSWFGADTQWAEDFVSIAYATDAYDGLVLADGINSVAAYSDVHTYSNMFGSTVGYISLSLLPGGKVTTAITGGLSAMGSSSERALLSGASWEEASWVGAISGTLGAVTGYGVGGGLTSGAQSWGQVVGKTFLGAGISTIEPIVNTGAEYFIYANDMVDANGNKVYDNILDYYVDGGGLTNTVMAFGAGFVGSGFESVTRRNFPISQKQIKDSIINDLKQLSANGYDIDQAMDYIINKGESNNSYVYRRATAETCYELLLANGHTPQSAGDIVFAKYNDILNNRGMTTVYVDEHGISYNVVNDFVEADQKYTIQYINSVINGMPEELRANINTIKLYDTFNPADFYWQHRYNNTNGYFKSAATGGDGTINIYATDYINPSTLYHEAGHCFDIGHARSNSQMYIDAIANDKKLNGLDSVTAYGKNANCEDFAETVAAYFGANSSVNIDNFPNRKLVLDMFFQTSDYPTTINKLQALNSSTILAPSIEPTSALSVKHNNVKTFLTELHRYPKNHYDGINLSSQLDIYKKIDIDTIYNDMVSMGKISSSDVSLNDIKGLFKKPGEVTMDGIKLSISNEDAIKRTLIEVIETSGGEGKTTSELFKELGLTLDDPKPLSMTTLETRIWYLESEKTIKSKLDIYMSNNPDASLREQAIFCYNERNRLRKVARESMQDELMGQYLMVTENVNFDKLYEKKLAWLSKELKRSVTEEETYKAIIDSSEHSRIPLNLLLGIGGFEK